MAQTLFYTLILSGMAPEDAYRECERQNVYGEEELKELHKIIIERKLNIAG